MSEYLKQAKDFLERNNAKVIFEFKECKFIRWEESRKQYQWWHNIYKVTLKRNGKQFILNFTDSAQNTRNNEKPNEYDILACLQKYDVGSYHDFCIEFGYEPYDLDFENYVVVNGEYYNKKTYKIYNACLKEYNNVMKLFGDVIEELEEIQ